MATFFDLLSSIRTNWNHRHMGSAQFVSNGQMFTQRVTGNRRIHLSGEMPRWNQSQQRVQKPQAHVPLGIMRPVDLWSLTVLGNQAWRLLVHSGEITGH